MLYPFSSDTEVKMLFDSRLYSFQVEHEILRELVSHYETFKEGFR